MRGPAMPVHIGRLGPQKYRHAREATHAQGVPIQQGRVRIQETRVWPKRAEVAGQRSGSKHGAHGPPTNRPSAEKLMLVTVEERHRPSHLPSKARVMVAPDAAIRGEENLERHLGATREAAPDRALVLDRMRCDDGKAQLPPLLHGTRRTCAAGL